MCNTSIYKARNILNGNLHSVLIYFACCRHHLRVAIECISLVMLEHNDIKHNETQHNDFRHNDAQHYDIHA